MPTASRSVADLFGGERVFRIGLLGCAGAGKTCLLAAVGEVDGVGTAGHTGHRVRVLEGTEPRTAAEAFRRGVEHLDGAARAMWDGNQPVATDPNWGCLTAVYRLTTPQLGQVTAVVTDYSGELLDTAPNLAERRRALSRVLADSDALVVLADVPRAGERAASATQLQYVREMFHEWAAGRPSGGTAVPVALVFTMWDRRPVTAPADRAAALDAFAAGTEHGQLVTTLRNTCPTFGVFAASAFGAHAPTNPHGPGDRPVRFPQDVYGVVEPFAWACEQCVARAHAELAAHAARLRWWAVWQARTARGTRAAARRLLARTPADGEVHAAARRAADRVARGAALNAVVSVTAVVAVLTIALLVGDWAVHGHTLREAERALADPNLPDDRYEDARARLDGYARSPAYRHALASLRLAPDRAAALVAQSGADREERQWRAVADAAHEQVRYEEGGRYLARYPGGRHANEARLLRAEVEERRRAEEIRGEQRAAAVRRRKEVDRIEADFDAAVERKQRVEAATALKRLEDLPPVPEGVETADDARRRAELDRKMSDGIKRLTTDATGQRWHVEWEPFRRRIASDVEGFNLKRAAEELLRAERELPGNPHPRSARATFAEKAMKVAEAKAAAMIKENAPDVVRAAIRDFDEARNDPIVKALLGGSAAHLSRLDELRRELVKQHDGTLYLRFRERPSKETAERFQHAALLKTMKPVAQAYSAYEDRRNGPHEFALVVTVGWGKWENKSTNEVTIEQQDGAEWRHALTVTGVTATSNGEYELPAAPFTAVPNRAMGFRVVVKQKTRVFESPKAELELAGGPTPEELAGGKVYELKQTTGDDCQAKVRVRAVGLPAPPNIPDWKE